MADGPFADLSRYAACERQKVEGVYDKAVTWRYVRLHAEPMHASDVLAWLVEQGHVKKVVADPGDEAEFHYAGWGTTYFAVPWERSVER